MITTLLLIVLGIVVGILGAILGIGGGIIMVPVLTFLFNMPIHNAIAISLVVITANSMSTSAVYLKTGSANINLGISLSIASVTGALIGSKTAVHLPQSTVMIILGIIQFIMAYLTYFKMKKGSTNIVNENINKNDFFYCEFIDKSDGSLIKYTPVKTGWNFLFSGFSGIFSGLSGAGGGAMIIPGMNLISNVPIKSATATSSFIIGFTAAAGSIVYMTAGYVDAKVACSIIFGIFAGTYISMKFFSKITDKKVSYLLILLLILVGIQMIYEVAVTLSPSPRGANGRKSKTTYLLGI